MCYEKDYPKVLVISHNSFSMISNNGKTFSSIFGGWSKDKIAQLYFQNEIPDLSVCNNFFYITDENMIFDRKINVGKKVTEKNKEQIKKTNSPIHTYARKKPLPIFSFFRNVIWSSGKWDNRNLYKWIEEFAPDVIFFVGGGAAFSYKITNRISRKYSIPVFLYYTDDYITPILTIDLFWWLNFIWLRRVLSKTLENVNKIFVIGEDMAKEYSRRFNKPCIPIMNAVEIEKYSTFYKDGNVENQVNNQLKIAYFGGLHLNRWKSLSQVGKAIKELSKERKIDISLRIYSSTVPEEAIMKSISDAPYIQYCGSVNENEIIEEMQKYDILIHVESFEKKMIQRTRLSISTKIPEYLASGKPILAVGPKELSSIKYLKKLGISYIIYSLEKNEMENAIVKVINDSDNHKEIGLKGIEIAKSEHSILKNRKVIRENLAEILDNKIKETIDNHCKERIQ